MARIAVIDYDMGNLHSVCKGLENAGGTPEITDDPKVISAADGVLLPGVGAFDPAVQHLRSRNLIEPIKQVIADGVPFLGICLGLQILFESGEEGDEPGLGIFPGKVRRFKSEPGLTIPHMGWNQLTFTQPSVSLWENLGDNPWVYFVHSYYVDPADATITAATITHGSQTVTAAIAYQNVMAVQFHPEKSSVAGLQLLSNFVQLVNSSQKVITSMG
ncbi:MAG: imidazole glycerol phosphate synthase subunit HisH [Limnospira sp. PMC 1291.21]|uniref:Imidazole glycerol phosphate synthase subunit HisH n=2 Tax=Limnospira TaxID=2596745 RepID=B5W546_LIMMA|nr:MULTISPECIES: imidazole glycerol phosphate synthase subunit HisH [Limnospira]AMW30647.1 imidazole glycerol phosphate synthase subunit HisH [Arthrospira platensis YZ]EKD07326.1 imidazole glycerol phosphate synthase glutamine amidotransferasesubunit [Arthrospira platensis C1]MDC0839387.1 imidazole glycerol phosphate synthase subunit HisH [Limnoraphis robusta]MDY7052771.1 imidazole glycerol phosphate synthase subunit HisH [Limnospira fusiformis LS22]QJB25887.1 imidazole glycerol phosphate synt